MNGPLVKSVHQVSFHRNGIGGAGFHAVLFTSDLDGPIGKDALMLGIVFDEPMHTAIVAVGPLSDPAVGVAFGENSWRGDQFDGPLREAIKNTESDGSLRVGPFALPLKRTKTTP